MCAALDEVIEMKKSTLTPSELAVMMVTELRTTSSSYKSRMSRSGPTGGYSATIVPGGGCIRNVSAG